MKMQIKLIIGLAFLIGIAILIINGIDLNVSATANAKAEANAMSISKAVSAAVSLSAAVAHARAQAINNTYIFNHKVRGLIWRVDVHDLKSRCNGSTWYTFCLGDWITPDPEAILDDYENKPLPWMQTKNEIRGKLYIGYFEKVKK